MRKGLIFFLLVVVAASVESVFGKDRNPAEYPERAKILSFSVQRGNGTFTHCNPDGSGNCLGIGILYHVLDVDIDGQQYTVSCHHCDPLVPGQTYPARLQLKDMEILIIHQKANGKWGQDNYRIVHMEAK